MDQPETQRQNSTAEPGSLQPDCSDAGHAGMFIKFEPRSPKAKTKVWAVMPKDSGYELGFVSWYGPWRKYCFSPMPHTVFEQVCLREIAQFCETATRTHKQPTAPGERPEN